MARRSNISTPPDGSLPEGPVRTCIGCRRRAAKSELLRVIAGSDAHGHPAVVPDPDGAAPGRGAHLHPTPGCYELAVHRQAFSRALLRKGRGGEGGLTSTPVAEYLHSHQNQQ